MARPDWLHALLFALALMMQACASRPVLDGGPPRSMVIDPSHLPDDPEPRDDPRSRFGNGPFYEVHGETYKVLDTNYGYRARGVASWYGYKFHGRPTSSRETFDMYAMTAAHRSLPLPSYVRVRNLRNNKSVVVRVNDRGPFVDNRLIDLSFAAATKLDMVADGTSLVEVSAISFDRPTSQTETATVADTARIDPAAAIFVQVGAFGEAENARRRFAQLRNIGIDEAFVHRDGNALRAIYRVRIGPIASVTEYDSIVERLQGIGISETHLVAD